MRLLVVADWHGSLRHARPVVDVAVKHGIGTIVHLGDFGIWPGYEGKQFIQGLSKYLTERGVRLWFVDGNHEDFTQLYSYPITGNGLRLVAQNIWHIPRGHVWEQDGMRMLGIGGAVSIDRASRIPGVSWWPEETVTLDDMDKVKQAGSVDVVFAHDCPTSVPMRGLINDPMSYWHRQQMNEVANWTQPTLWFHGHMHKALHYWHRTRNDFGLDVEVIGLDCNGAPGHYCILDTAAKRVEFIDSPELFGADREPWYSRGGRFWPPSFRKVQDETI